MRCAAYCIAQELRLTAVANAYRAEGWLTKLYRNVLHMTHAEREHDIFAFPHGCFVVWGFLTREERQTIAKMQSFANKLLPKFHVDRFSYRYGEETTLYSQEHFNVDIITLDSDNPQIKLAISYGLAQSIKLDAYEDKITETINHNRHLIDELALAGSISLKRKDISRRIGEIFQVRSSVNLNSEYLDIPEYFWQFSSLEEYYLKTERFLEISSRVEVLNNKLIVLHELLDMLGHQLEHRHSSQLEITIIVLIVIEIVISIVHY